MSHTRAHVVRAVLEGVSLTMGRILSIVREAGVPIEQIRLGGGGAKSALWRQMLADSFDAPVRTLETEEGPAHGAALMAGVGVGVWGSVVEACDAAIRLAGVTEPVEETAALYAALGEDLDAAYESLRGTYASLSTR